MTRPSILLQGRGRYRQPPPPLLKERADGRSSSLLVRIFTAQGRRSLEPHAWAEDLLKDFFQSILGINLSVILLSPTECLIFCGNHAQGMSWDESLHYAHQLAGVHPWTSYMIDVVAHQQTLKEAQHEMQVAREFTHERTKQRITHLNALAMAPVANVLPAMPQRSPWGQGMTEAGRPILRPTAAWRDESRGVRLYAEPYPARHSTGEP